MIDLSKLVYKHIDSNRVLNFEFNKFDTLTINSNKIRTVYTVTDDDDKIIIDFVFKYIKNNIVPKRIYSKSLKRISKQIQGRLNDNYFPICNFDINNYFSSINHEILIQKINSFNDPILLKIISKFISAYKRSTSINQNSGLPPGINLSHILAELYLMELDIRIKKYAKETQLFYYYRYVDNIALLSSEKSTSVECNNIVDSIIDDIRLLKLEYRNENFSKNSLNFIGFNHLINNDKKVTLCLSERTILKLKRDFTKKFKFFKKSVDDILVDGCPYDLFSLYYQSFRSLNYSIRGGHDKVFDNAKATLILYGCTPIIHIINDSKQIEHIDIWFFKLWESYKRVFKLSYKYFNKNFTGAMPNRPEYIYYRNLNIDSFKNWAFRYKKDFYNALSRANIMNTLDDPKGDWNKDYFNDILFMYTKGLVNKKNYIDYHIKNSVSTDNEDNISATYLSHGGIIDFVENPLIEDAYGVDFDDLDPDQQHAFEDNRWVPIFDTY